MQQQHPALEVQKHTAVVHIDAAHHRRAVIADAALGVEEARGVLVDAHPRPQQGQIVRAAQPEHQLFVRDARQHQPHIHPALGGVAQCIQHLLANGEIGRIKIDVLL